MIDSNKRWIPILLALAFCLRFTSCAGDGEIFADGSFASSTASLADGLILSWNAPVSYSDATLLDPFEELDVYEIYVNQTGIFFPDDEPVAYVSAIDSYGNITESFDLGNLIYTFTDGQTYHVSMRSASKLGSRSDFSPVFTFTIQADSEPAADYDQFLCTPPALIMVQPAA